MSLVDCKNSLRRAVVRQVNSDKVSPDQAQYLLECVNGTRRFVCSIASGPGRSLYAPPNESGLPGSKMKGAGGLRRKGRNRLAFYSPQPNKSYSSGDSHTALGPDLTFSRIISRPKAENSLRIGGAEMEFRAQTRLSIHGIGFDGLCWGEFLGQDGHSEVDLNGYPTGFAVSEYDLDYIPVSRVLGYGLDDNGLIGERLHHDTLDDDALGMHFGIVKRMGDLKRKMAVDAELGRHSSTLANFLYNADRDDLLLTDTDTVVDYREIEGKARGSQFLRDSVSDLVKRLSELQFSAPSDQVPVIMTQVVLDFLTGFFADSVRMPAIHGAVKELNILKRVNEVNRQGLQAGANLSGATYFKDMYPEMYIAIYRLLLQSDLTDTFQIEKIDPEIIYQRAKIFYAVGLC